jgi:DNA-directed RNA polymerase specialized sigma24 family protein
MTNAQRVSLVYQKHHDWLIACAVNLTSNLEQAQELVQDLYLQLMEMPNLEKIVYNETDLNLFYLYKILKSKFLNNIKAAQKRNQQSLNVDLIENTPEQEYDAHRDQEIEDILKVVDEALNDQLHWFDSKLFVTYIEENHSINSLHIATKISKNAIFNSLTKTKKLIRKKTQDENLHY